RLPLHELRFFSWPAGSYRRRETDEPNRSGAPAPSGAFYPKFAALIHMRIVFVGTGAIGVPALRALQTAKYELVGVVTQPDKPVGRDQHIQSPPIKQAAEGSVPVIQPARIKDQAAIEQIRSWLPDVIVVMAYGQILPPDV